MAACVELQRRVWGYTERDTVPDQIFVVARKTGGEALGAYEREKPVGFALAFVALREGSTYLHSHMVAVLPEYRDRGIGRLLKLAQRKNALARGIDLIEWTFDPLQLKNAHFNIASLGAIARRYVPNLYGRTSSPLHAGLATDRLVAEWRLRSAGVEATLAGKSRPPSAGCERIAVPNSIREICESEPEKAASIQSEMRTRFQDLFAKNYAAVGFEFKGDEGRYILERYED